MSEKCNHEATKPRRTHEELFSWSPPIIGGVNAVGRRNPTTKARSHEEHTRNSHCVSSCTFVTSCLRGHGRSFGSVRALQWINPEVRAGTVAPVLPPPSAGSGCRRRRRWRGG